MQITNDEKSLIRDNLHYIPSTGTILWRDGSAYRRFIGAPVPMTNQGEYDKPALFVGIGDKWFPAADVCWFLWKSRWPKHGIVFADKSKAGRTDLRASNLRLRRKPEYVKQGRAVWVPRALAARVINRLRFHAAEELADEMLDILTKEYKR